MAYNDNTQKKNDSKTPDRWTSKDIPPAEVPFYDVGHAKGTADASGDHPNFPNQSVASPKNKGRSE